MAHAGKIAFQLRDQFGVGAALKGLGQKRSAGIEHVGGKRCRSFDQANDAQLNWVAPIDDIMAEKVDARIVISAASNTRALNGIEPRKRIRQLLEE